ncbi:MAG: hypothetical protein WD355_04600 [Balneolaceae bacterium]
MKSFLTLTIPVLLIALAPYCLTAQNNPLDQERMQRDLRIMERTLDELFTLQGAAANPLINSGNTFRIGGSAKGTYLSGFGVIISIPDRTRFIVRFTTNQSMSEEIRYYFEGGEEVAESSIRERMRDFLTHYAPAIGQLHPDEKVMVLYGADPGQWGNLLPGLNVFRELRINSSSKAKQTEDLSVIAMSVSRQEMDALRSGQISEAEYLEQIRTSVTPREEENRKPDLDIFAGILETGLNEAVTVNGETRESERGNRARFTIIRKPAYLHLDTFGVIYQLELNPSPFQLDGVGYQLNQALRGTLGNLSNLHPDSLMPDSVNWSRIMSDEERQEYRRNMEEFAKRQQEVSERLEEERSNARLEMEESLGRSIELYLDTIEELILDYGHTLQSLDTEDSLLISVSLNIPGRIQDESLPRRADLRIPMSDLELFKRGEISREEARGRITLLTW